MPPIPLDVLLVARPGDAHAAVIDSLLKKSDRRVARLSLHEIRERRFTWEPGRPPLFHLPDGPQAVIGPFTSIWWRRTGWANVDDLADEGEQALIAAECRAIFEGALLASGARWLDPPTAIDLAELKLHHLEVAQGLGLRIPATLVTNDCGRAVEFGSPRDLIAKPVSSGPGLAPYADIVGREELQLVAASPTLLQELLPGDFDLRVVTVAGQAFVWERDRRLDDAVDWRAAESVPGAGFVLRQRPSVARDALRLAGALHLTFSVQDWLASGEVHYFLEVNPQGDWLFLPQSEETVASALATVLTAAPAVKTPGYWPSTWKRLAADVLPARFVADDDGLIAPSYQPSVPHCSPEDWPLVVEEARRASDRAVARAATAEEKADRMLNRCLWLLTGGFALAAHQIGVLDDKIAIAALVLTVLGSVFVATAMGHAIAIDAPGLYAHSTLRNLHDVNDLKTAILTQEDHAQHVAQWTARNKHHALLTGRAALSRGLLFMLCALIASLWVEAAGRQAGSSNPPPITDTCAPSPG